MLLAVPYFAAARACATMIANGGPGWLNLLMALFLWNALEFAIMGPLSLLLLANVRVREAIAERQLRRHRDPHPPPYSGAELVQS